MKIEWDEAKRQQTLAERGLDFADVARLDWDSAFTVEDFRFDYAEARYVTLGLLDGRLHVLAWCWRGSALRVISLRKANARERRLYEQS